MRVCDCEQYCLDTVCRSSDSLLTVRLCWCAECADMRKEVAR